MCCWDLFTFLVYVAKTRVRCVVECMSVTKTKSKEESWCLSALRLKEWGRIISWCRRRIWSLPFPADHLSVRTLFCRSRVGVECSLDLWTSWSPWQSRVCVIWISIEKKRVHTRDPLHRSVVTFNRQWVRQTYWGGRIEESFIPKHNWHHDIHLFCLLNAIFTSISSFCASKSTIKQIVNNREQLWSHCPSPFLRSISGLFVLQRRISCKDFYFIISCYITNTGRPSSLSQQDAQH